MKIVYLPLDERPCNYEFAARIAEDSGVKVIRPELHCLGKKKQPADFEAVKSFLVDNAPDADAYILSVDMLLYGGIVPSRLHSLTCDELGERLGVIKQIKEINPKAKIYAFALIMRCPKYSSADEEPDYYEFCGREIFLSGQIKHKTDLGLLSEEESEVALAEYVDIVGDHITDFENRRLLNREMLINTIAMLHREIDFLIIPQDDSAEFGYTSMDRELIKAAIKENGFDDVAMYPGADEVGMTLLARAACDYVGYTPRIYCDFAHPSAPSITPLYEDRPLGKTLPFQIDSAGCVRSDSRSESDIILYLNYPSRLPVEVWEEKSAGYDERELDGFIGRMQRDVEEGRVVALADGAYCNGGDAELMQLIYSRMSPLSLSAYAGWNTSSNTLGTVICQAVFVSLFGDSAGQKKFLAERIYEDVGYCGKVRKYVTENILPGMGYDYFNAGETSGAVADVVRSELEKYIGGVLPDIAREYSIDRCQMPWKRMFEVDLTVRKN